jgi:uncharacterized protein (DUF362 family)
VYDVKVMIIIKKISNDIEKNVCDALTSLGYKPKRDSIFIKPNIANASKPDDPYITNPRIVGGMIDYLKYLGYTDIAVGEGPVGGDVDEIFKTSGFSSMCKEKGVELLDLNKVKRETIIGDFGEIELPTIIFESEYINVAKLKTHMLTTVTLCLKNQKGLLRIGDKRKFHQNLHQNIASLAKVVSPNLSIIDALNGVEGNGPGRMGRKVKDINILICGTNPVSTDAIASKFMGIDPEEVRHLILAKNAGIGDFSDIMIGEAIEEVGMNFEKPTDHHKIFNVYYWWTDETCSGCSSLLGDIKKKVSFSPKYLMKLFIHGFFFRLDLVTGKFSDPPINSGKIICIGDCTKKLAENHGLTWTSGCPPKVESILEKL